jgi:hypothetical protein
MATPACCQVATLKLSWLARVSVGLLAMIIDDLLVHFHWYLTNFRSSSIEIEEPCDKSLFARMTGLGLQVYLNWSLRWHPNMTEIVPLALLQR